MSALPSIVIGLGTSGSEIVAATYQNYKAYCQRTGDNEEIVQFLMIDTQNPVKGGEELYAMGNHLMIGVPNGENLRKAKWELDLFFHEWWPENYTKIGRLYPGAGTIPAKGKLAYWGGIGRPGAQNYFGQKFLECRDKSIEAYAQKGVPAVFDIQVYLVCTLSGGTGSGVFLDIAQTIANMDMGIEMLLYGVFILPDVIKMRAENAKHEQIGANGYGALIALNYWSTESHFREPDIGKFMVIDEHNTITGDDSPIDISWFIGRQNRNGLTLKDWEEYKDLVVSTLSMQCFEDFSENIQARVIDKDSEWLGTFTKGAKPQPRNFGSFASYRLRYRPEKAVDYLTCVLTNRGIDAFLEKPVSLEEQTKAQVEEFIINHQIREFGVDKNEVEINEVLDGLKNYKDETAEFKLYKNLMLILEQLERKDPKNVLVRKLLEVKSAGVLKAEFEKFRDRILEGLYGRWEKEQGIGFTRLLNYNHQRLLKRVFLDQETEEFGDEEHSLFKMIQEKILKEAAGFEGGVLFLEILIEELKRHMESLELELNGKLEIGIASDLDDLKLLEGNLDVRLERLGKQMFEGLFGGRGDRREDAVQRFEEDWWKPWLRLKISTMAKEEAISFYTEAIQEAEALKGLMTQNIKPGLQQLQSTNRDTQKSIYTESAKSNKAVREEFAFSQGDPIAKHFEKQLTNSEPIALDEIREVVSLALQEYSQQEERTAKTGRLVCEKMAPAVMERLDSEGESQFADETAKITLWEALKINSGETSKTKIKSNIEHRLRDVELRTEPFWRVDRATFNFVVGPIHRIRSFSYDEEALSQFENSSGVNISRDHLENANTGNVEPQAAADLASEAYKPSPYELKLLILESGVPLQLVENIEPHKPEFLKRIAKSNIPVLSDVRMFEYQNEVNLPTWDLALRTVSEDEERNIVKLLMLEHFGVMTSPLVKKHQTSGLHKLGDLNLHNSTRYYAFLKALELIKENKTWWQDQLAELEVKHDQYSPEDWRFEHMVCHQRLRKVIGVTPTGNVKDAITEQLNIFKRIIKEDLKIETAEILKLDPQIQKRLKKETG